MKKFQMMFYCDEKTIVQPDVMVVCDRSKIGKVVYGAPDFVQDRKPRIYGFDSKIPIRVLDGECQIDFGRIYEFVRFLYHDEEDSDE